MIKLLIIYLTLNYHHLEPTEAIALTDQPKLFAALNDWNGNLFKRVNDCIRDTVVLSTDNYQQRRLKAWAMPRCNQILRVLNANWDNITNGAAVLVNQENCWVSIASRLYAVSMNTQSCGVASTIVNCVYITP